MQDYHPIIKPLMGEKRYRHSLAVARQAEYLARRWNADPQQAYTAGILHDICKELPKAEQLAIIQKAGEELDEVSRHNHSLWHAVAGSIYVKERLGITDPGIISAIRYHTSARAEMTLLEQIIYLADLTSEDRDYPDIDRMRACVDTSLDTATWEALRYIVQDLQQRQREICPDTYRAYRFYGSK